MSRIIQALCLGACLTLQCSVALSVQLGPRPFYLVDKMDDSALKDKLALCAENRNNYRESLFSIGHRGAPLQFPEHTEESYIAAARMGAGVLECDVTFTQDKALVCRHSQCDLHATTNILKTPLAEKCSAPFTPAKLDASGKLIKPAYAKCCTSDISVAEFKTLKGKMEAFNPRARSVDEYLAGTPEFRTDLYATGGTLLTHAESIELFKKLKVSMIPELKAAKVDMPFDSYTQADYAHALIQEYIDAKVDPKKVFPQSFNLRDIQYWLETSPEFAKQAVLLDSRNPVKMAKTPPTLQAFEELKSMGINYIAPPMSTLLSVEYNEGVPLLKASEYARRASEAGLDIIAWSLERSGRMHEDVIAKNGAYYYNTTVKAMKNDGDVFNTVHALVEEVGVVGLFSDWPATTTFYANCMGTR